MNAEQLRDKFKNEFLPYRDENWSGWHQRYLSFVKEVANAKIEIFSTSDFQRRLWDNSPVTGIGPGSAVTVEGAYGDIEVIKLLWSVKIKKLPANEAERGKALQDAFDEILELVKSRHSKTGKNPTARLLRVFAALRPENVLCIVSAPWLKHARNALELPRSHITLRQHIIIQDFLQKTLMSDGTLESNININQFAWWLAVQHQNKEEDSAGVSTADKDIVTATETPSLTILPVAAQRKGLFHVSENIDLLRSIVETSVDGATRNELRDLILEERTNLNSSSAFIVINQAKALGLLRVENNTYFLTKLGEDLRDGEPVDEVFVPTMVRRVFGIAHLLAFLRDGGWAYEKNSLLRKMQSVYPAWTTKFAPSSLITWGVQLGLIEQQKDANGQTNIVATEIGQYWASGIPEDMSPWVVGANLDVDAEEHEEDTAAPDAAAATLAPPPLNLIADHFKNEKLILPERFLNRLHAALHAVETKKFILLAGLSGTGKTSIARAYASSYCKALNINAREHYCEIAVWPDWSDPTGLIGFVNPLHEEPTFQKTEGLSFLLKANDNPDKPYFLCLDEMNLARVEHYFAPFLSAMEGLAGKQKLKLHAYADNIDNIPPSIPWPRNLYIFGTVNMDETTHPFSDKVLDRAFPFQLWNVDKESWHKTKVQDDETAAEVLDLVYPVLSELYDALYIVRRHFGYRVFDEVLNFCNMWAKNTSSEDAPMAEAIDAAIYSKVLPKIRGEDTDIFSNALADVEKICASHELTQCADRVAGMRTDLATTGLVRFWS